MQRPVQQPDGSFKDADGAPWQKDGVIDHLLADGTPVYLTGETTWTDDAGVKWFAESWRNADGVVGTSQTQIQDAGA